MTKIPILFELMAKKSLTLKKLSDDTNISIGNIGDWKSGKSSPSIKALKKLSEYFKVSVECLIECENIYLSSDEFIKAFQNLDKEQKKDFLSKIK